MDLSLTNISTIKELSSIVHSFITAFAIILGALVAYFKFIKIKEYDWNLQLNIGHEILPYHIENTKVLSLKIGLCNVGKVPIRPNKEYGCVIKIKELPQNINLREPIDWHSNSWEEIFKYDIMEQYVNDPFPYEISPGCEERELISTVLPVGHLVLVEVKFIPDVENKGYISTFALITIK